MNKIPPCRLFPIFAREESVCVIFRRGPSKWTQLILWNTGTDIFIGGQWFKGRIYERRCDLSPDGTKLIYFAQNINKKSLSDVDYTYAWTAISKPPYLTALALWAKGDCWHGGGFFEDNHTVFLNHKPEVAIPHPDHLPIGLNIISNPEACGENDPIYSQRLTRDGWKVVQEWNVTANRRKPYYETIAPEIREKRHGLNNLRIRMERRLDDLEYSEKFTIRRGNDEICTIGSVAGRGSWIDFDQRGRPIVLNEGKILVAQVSNEKKADFVELLDLNPNKPETLEAPEWAKNW